MINTKKVLDRCLGHKNKESDDYTHICDECGNITLKFYHKNPNLCKYCYSVGRKTNERFNK